MCLFYFFKIFPYNEEMEESGQFDIDLEQVCVKSPLYVSSSMIKKKYMYAQLVRHVTIE